MGNSDYYRYCMNCLSPKIMRIESDTMECPRCDRISKSIDNLETAKPVSNLVSTPERQERRQKFINLLSAELDRAYEKHGSLPWSRHEFYAILKEEVDEVWDAIKQDLPLDSVSKEIIQVAAMCLRFMETPQKYGEGVYLLDILPDPDK